MSAGSRKFAAIAPHLRGRHFLLLDALGTERSVHKAATKLNVTQSAATKLLAEIESYFGQQLFERSSRGVVPNKYGEALIARARRVLTEVNRMPEDIEQLAKRHIGVVRVGAFSFAAIVMVPNVIRKIIDEEPGIMVHLLEASPEVLMAALRRKELDIVVGRIPAGEHGIQFRVLGDQLVSIIAGITHPLASKPRVTWKAAAAGPWVLTPKGGATRAALEATLARHGMQLPPTQIETTSYSATEALVERGMLAMMPYDVAIHMSERRRIVVLPLKLEVVLPPIAAAWEEDEELSQAGMYFLNKLLHEPT